MNPADEIAQLREELNVNRTALEMKHDEIERLRAVYESAVQGRRDFRNVYREAEANADNLRAEIERLRERCAALERAVDYEAGEPGTVEYHKALFDRLHAAEAEIERLRAVAQIRYELLRECQSEFRARGATGLVETIEAVLKEKQHEPG